MLSTSKLYVNKLLSKKLNPNEDLELVNADYLMFSQETHISSYSLGKFICELQVSAEPLVFTWEEELMKVGDKAGVGRIYSNQKRIISLFCPVFNEG